MVSCHSQTILTLPSLAPKMEYKLETAEPHRLQNLSRQKSCSTLNITLSQGFINLPDGQNFVWCDATEKQKKQILSKSDFDDSATFRVNTSLGSIRRSSILKGPGLSFYSETLSVIIFGFNPPSPLSNERFFIWLKLFLSSYFASRDSRQISLEQPPQRYLMCHYLLNSNQQCLS